MSNLRNLVFTSVILNPLFHAWAAEIYCTTSTRSACYDKGCQIHKDSPPSTYKISGVGQYEINIKKYIGGKETSGWSATNWSDRTDKYFYIERRYVLSVFVLTNDKKYFTLTLPSGVSAYNSSISIGQTPDPEIGAQIETGTCIS